MAVEAQVRWAARTPAERANVLLVFAEQLSRAGPDLRELIVRETGCISAKADYEVAAAVSELKAAAALAVMPAGEVLPTGHGGRVSLMERVPVGVVGAITPWNFPLVLGMRVVAPALALGYVVVLKPSIETPLCGGMVLGGVLAEIGAPEGLLQVVPGDEEVGRRLVAHRGVSMVHFTGSSRVGAKIASAAGALLKKVSLELGGNNALIVLDDADVDQAAMILGLVLLSLPRPNLHIGWTPHRSGRNRRRLRGTPRGRARAITLGDPLKEPVGLGPMINERQTLRAKGLMDEALWAGARVVAGGGVKGLYFQPTVLADVTPDMRIWREEIFALVAPVLSVSRDDEAVEVANDTEYGLVDAVIGNDAIHAWRVARRLETGMVHVNDATPQDEATAPFGGYWVVGSWWPLGRLGEPRGLHGTPLADDSNRARSLSVLVG